MRASLAALCGRFIENRDIVKAAFAWENSYLYPVCAAVITDHGMTANEERLKECREILKEQTGVFSNFRSTARLPMIAMMSVDSDPAGKLARALAVHDCLKEHFWGSAYLPLTSMILADGVVAEDYEAFSARTRRIYDRMKQEHPFLTSGEDSVFAALLALAEKGEEELVAEAEACYRLLKQEFFSGNAVQSLSHVLAICEGGAEEKCRKILELFRDLKSRKCQYGSGYELATLGVLAMLPASQADIVSDLMDVDAFLSGQKGYGVLGPGRKQRLMHAGMLVASDYLRGDSKMNTAALHGTIALIVAQQAALCAAVVASSTAAASSSNS